MSLSFKEALVLLDSTNDFGTVQVGRAIDLALRPFPNTDLHKEAQQHGFGLGKLIVRILESLEHYFTAPDMSQGTRNLEKTTNFLWNYTIGRPDFACELSRSGAISRIIAILKLMAKQPEDNWHVRQLEALMRALHNCILGDECTATNRLLYRKEGLFEVLQNWINSSEITLKVDALLILSYITNPKESEILEKNGKVVAFLVQLLKKATNTSYHKATVDRYVELSAKEILDGLYQLMAHDANKRIVVENGGVPIITRMLKPIFSREERLLAISALWSISFSFDEDLSKSDEIQKSIIALRELTTSDDKELQTNSRRALFEIEGELQRATHGGGHVMISYNWTHKETAVKIRDDLRKSGHNIWIDIERMHGDILECMANAVKQVDVVLLCMSHHYYLSSSCRQEAEYAMKKKKPIIPIIVEPGYKPEGWLDLLIGMELYYDLTSDEKMSENMPGLKRGIKNKIQVGADEVDNGSPPHSRASSSDGSPPDSRASSKPSTPDTISAEKTLSVSLVSAVRRHGGLDSSAVPFFDDDVDLRSSIDTTPNVTSNDPPPVIKEYAGNTQEDVVTQTSPSTPAGYTLQQNDPSNASTDSLNHTLMLLKAQKLKEEIEKNQIEKEVLMLRKQLLTKQLLTGDLQCNIL